MTPPERLARAVETCGYRCIECGSGTIALHWAPALGWVPTIRHWQARDGEWCPALGSYELMAIESMDLLDALDAVLTHKVTALEPDPIWHARELAAA